MLSKEIKIGKSVISDRTPPYFIAEAGSNHNQSMDTARRLVDVAAKAGANAVKFQLFQAQELYPKGTEMYDIFKSVELNADWVEGLKRHSQEQGIEFLASAFDRKSVDVLEAVGVAAHKIASSETTNIPLLGYIAKTGKPLFVSTGMCDLVDVSEAVLVCEEAGNHQIALLQCGAMYPLPPELANLRVLDRLAQTFDCQVGFSDHTLGLATSIAAVARGARVIEKHFTLDRKSKGPDHFYALEPTELETLVKGCHEAFLALGSPVKEMLPDERKFGRRDGVYLTRDLPRGSKITAADLKLQRPATGIRGRHKDMVTGAVLREDVKAGTALNWKSIEF